MRLRDLGIVCPAIVTVPSVDASDTNCDASFEALTPDKVKGVFPVVAFAVTANVTVIKI